MADLKSTAGDGHAGDVAVLCVAMSGDGRRAVSGGMTRRFGCGTWQR